MESWSQLLKREVQMAAGWLLWSSVAFILSITYLLAECHTVRSLLIKMLSQVTVGVLLTIYTFQVLLLNEDVNAFLWEEQNRGKLWDMGIKAPLWGCSKLWFWPPKGVSWQTEDGNGQRTQTTAIHSPLSDNIQGESFANLKLNWTALTGCHSRGVTRSSSVCWATS